MRVIPIRAQAIGDVLDDLPVGPASLQRLEHLIKPLDAPLRAGERAFLFEARAGGQHHVGKLARVAEENVLHHKKIELGERRRERSWRWNPPG